MSATSSGSPMGTNSPVESVREYAPSPRTCSQALTRANQLRVQALLRQLILMGAGADGSANQDEQPVVGTGNRLSTLRVLRKSLREIDYNLSWLTQLDFLETIDRLLREESAFAVGDDDQTDWRLVHDSTQLLMEAMPRLKHQLDDQHTIGEIFSTVIQNLGHRRSEVRRASLLLLNGFMNDQPEHFKLVLGLFIDYGLANHRNPEAQRGAILSLPLLMTEQLVADKDLLPLVKCLSELLVDANEQLFYSLYLALQRLNLTLGDHQFGLYLRQCDPEAMRLYKQAASRNNSLVASLAGARDEADERQQQQPARCSLAARATSGSASASASALDSPEPGKQVTFEGEPRSSQGEQRPDSAAAADNSTPDSMVDSTAPTRQNAHSDYGADFSSASESAQSDIDQQEDTLCRQPQITTTPMASYRPPLEHNSSVSSTGSSEAHLVNPAHYMSRDALSGRPLANFDLIHHIDHSTTGLAINDLGPVSCSPTMEYGPGAENELKFGIFPRHLISAASSGQRYLDRIEALEEIMCMIRESPINHLAILMTYFDSFLEQFLARLIEPGVDYKIELIAIDIIETIVVKTKISTMQYARPLISLLMKTLNESKTIFRDNTIRVIHKMMAYLPPQHVIDAIFEHKHSKSALVREETINRVTAAVLEYDKNEFNLTKLCYHVLPMLADHEASVRLASLECIATLAHALGPQRIGSLLTAAEAVQTGCDYDGLLDAINARLLRYTLPKCNSDGSVRYVIKPFLSSANSTHHQEHQAADVRWVLGAPSSRQHLGAATSAGAASATALGQHQPELPNHRQHHRLGVYSPPDASQRRRSSVNLGHHHLLGVQPDAQPTQAPAPARRAAKGQAQGPKHRSGDYSAESQHQVAAAAAATASEWTQPPARRQSTTRAQLSSGRDIQSETLAATRPAPSNSTLNGTTRDQQAADWPAQQKQQQQQQTLNDDCGSEAGNRVATQPSAHHEHGNCHSRATAADLHDPMHNQVELAARAEGRNADYSSGATRDNASEILRQQQSNKSQAETRSAHLSPPPSPPLGAPVRQSSLVEESRTRRRRSSQFGRTRKQEVSNRRRSSSQESSSSTTDTNKILFQFYLRKFKESLAADHGGSIAYSDPTQAYALSQHQSRFQQTSFDYDSDSVGKIPDTNLTGGQNRQSFTKSKTRTSVGPMTSVEGQVEAGSGSRPNGMATERGRGGAVAVASIGSGQREEFGRRESSASSDSPLTVLENREDESRAKVSSEQQTRVRSNLRNSVEQLDRDEAQLAEDKQTTQAGGQRRKSVAEKGSRRKSFAEAKTSPDIQRQSTEREHQDLRPEAKRDLRAQTQAPPLEQGDSEVQQPSERLETNHEFAPKSREVGQESQPETSVTSQAELRRKSLAHEGRQASVTTIDGSTSTHSNSQDEQHLSGGDRRRSRRLHQRNRSQEERLDEDEAADREVRRRSSRSQPPTSGRGGRSGGAGRSLTRTPASGHRKSTNQAGEQVSGGQKTPRAISVSPSLASSVNIRHILENVAQVEGPFQDAHLALKVALDAIESPCWSTKVEGILALIRLATYHQPLVASHSHEIISKVANETTNLRSTVARSAIFALGDLSSKLKRHVEPEVDIIVQALLTKSSENVAFIKDDIRKAFALMVENLTSWRLASSLIIHGSNHKNVHVRRMASQIIASLVERMGAAKCLVGARDISAQLIPAAAKFSQDSSPHTRYYGRFILARIMQHGAFDRLMRKNLTPNLYRSTLGIIESVKRRGPGEPPTES